MFLLPDPELDKLLVLSPCNGWIHVDLILWTGNHAWEAFEIARGKGESYYWSTKGLVQKLASDITIT
jgi:hypothetical protein